MSVDAASHEALVRVGPMVNIPALLQELGCIPGPVFESAGFALDEFTDTEHRLPYIKTSRLWAACVEATGCDHFGLLLGQKAGLSYLGVAGFLANSAETVGEALQVLVENLDLHDGGSSCDLLIEKDYSRLTFRIHQPGISAAAQIYDTSSVIMCEIMRSLIGGPWNASQVLLTRKRPSNSGPFRRYFRTSILFNSEVSGIVFPSQNLEIKSPTRDKLLYRHLELQVGVLHQMKHNEIVEMLPSVLQQGLLQKRYSASEIADAFAVQERTLHRRLKSAGTSFRQELNRARESLGVQLLVNSSLPIYDIAISLGYADSSGFIRAFNKWTGLSPSIWRKKNGL